MSARQGFSDDDPVHAVSRNGIHQEDQFHQLQTTVDQLETQVEDLKLSLREALAVTESRPYDGFERIAALITTALQDPSEGDSEADDNFNEQIEEMSISVNVTVLIKTEGEGDPPNTDVHECADFQCQAEDKWTLKDYIAARAFKEVFTVMPQFLRTDDPIWFKCIIVLKHPDEAGSFSRARTDDDVVDWLHECAVYNNANNTDEPAVVHTYVLVRSDQKILRSHIKREHGISFSRRRSKKITGGDKGVAE